MIVENMCPGAKMLNSLSNQKSPLAEAITKLGSSIVVLTPITSWSKLSKMLNRKK